MFSYDKDLIQAVCLSVCLYGGQIIFLGSLCGLFPPCRECGPDRPAAPLPPPLLLLMLQLLFRLLSLCVGRGEHSDCSGLGLVRGPEWVGIARARERESYVTTYRFMGRIRRGSTVAETGERRESGDRVPKSRYSSMGGRECERAMAADGCCGWDMT